ncbi:MAG: thioredoxin domain-containing protein, partial [Bacteroidota bacterium]
AIMAHNLFTLGHILELEKYLSIAKQMLVTLNPMVEKEPRYLAHWASLYLKFLNPQVEIAVVGKEYLQVSAKLHQQYLPNTMIQACEISSKLPLLAQKEAINGKTTIYVCRNKTCQLPVHTVEEALKQVYSG